MSDKDKVIIFDTTLRDGEQSPGATMNLEEKVLIAELLDNMGVDVIEAGFGAASQGDFDAIDAVARQVKNATVCSLARAIDSDIDAAGESVKNAVKPRIHTFLATSPLHMKYKLRMEPEEVLQRIRSSVEYASKYTNDIDWSPEDATRSDHDFLCRAIEIAIDAGATAINIPDTVGYTVPHEFFELFTMIKNRVPNIDKAILSVHCHNDLGLAVANSLAALDAGARQIECTINGIGERAGNASLEEIVMAIKTRKDILPYSCDIDTTQIMKASRLVSNVTGLMVQNNKAIVGANAFAHESGIHQAGMLKHAETYEIMTPESVGWTKTNLVLGKHSGRAAFKDRLKSLGFELGDNALEDAFARFKTLADKKKEIYDDDLISLAGAGAEQTDAAVKFVSMSVNCGSGENKAEVTLSVDGVETTAQCMGDGPVDATFKAIRALVPHEASLELYQVAAVTKGIDAQAEVTVRLVSGKDVLINGTGADVDTLVASAIAYISAINKLQNYEDKIEPQGVSL
jgi:2-isopropylmalate synthase